MESLLHPTIMAVIYLLSMMIIGSAIQWTFLIKLKKHHPQQWARAGNPTIMNNGDLMKAWPTTKYLMKSKFKESGCVEGTSFCLKFRNPMVYSYFLACSSFLMFFISIFVFGWPPGWS